MEGRRGTFVPFIRLLGGAQVVALVVHVAQSTKPSTGPRKLRSFQYV